MSKAKQRRFAIKNRGGRTLAAGRGVVVNAGMTQRVGFYGCETIDRVVRVGARGDHFPRGAQLDCPCGRQHAVSIMWRALTKGESLRAEVWTERSEDESPGNPGAHS